jgi:hypothetical protein
LGFLGIHIKAGEAVIESFASSVLPNVLPRLGAGKPVSPDDEAAAQAVVNCLQCISVAVPAIDRSLENMVWAQSCSLFHSMRLPDGSILSAVCWRREASKASMTDFA